MASRHVKNGCIALAATSLISLASLNPVLADEVDAPYLGLGQESCQQYLQDVAGNQTAQQLYSAWLAGFVTIAYSQLAPPNFFENASDVHAANDWITAYCTRRATDSFLTATLSLLMDRERHFR